MKKNNLVQFLKRVSEELETKSDEYYKMGDEYPEAWADLTWSQIMLKRAIGLLTK